MLGRPHGDAFRETLGERARLVTAFETAFSIDAMTKCYSMYGRAEYIATHPTDYEQYPDEWQTGN